MSSAIAQGGATVNPPPRTQEQIRIASLITNAHNVVAVLEQYGVRFSSGDLNSLTNLVSSSSSEAIEHILSRHVLFQVHINPEMRVKVARGPATAGLNSGAWRYFLARIENESGTTAPLQGESPQRTGNPAAASDAWLEMKVHDDAAVPAKLSGQPVEYRVIALRTEVDGQREARISLHVGQGTQDIGFRNEVDILFRCSKIVFELSPDNESFWSSSSNVLKNRGRGRERRGGRRAKPSFQTDSKADGDKSGDNDINP